MSSLCHRLPCLALLLAVAGALPARGNTVLHREWTTGVAPVSWGFGVEPASETREVMLTTASAAVEVLDARGGPGLPADWTVEVVAGKQVVARGVTPIAAGARLSAFLVVETNRSSADITSRGALPVEWRVRLAAEPASDAAATEVMVTFEPVLELSDAVSRGLVLATLEPLSPWGPAEVTVDNPTWQPLWLDLPPGSIVRVGGEDWVVGLVRPFRMMRKQKTGRTVDAFPLVPPPDRRDVPRRLSFASRPGGDHSALVAATALALRRLRVLAREGARLPGPFEALQPFEFWPLLLKWALWSQTGAPAPDLLRTLTTRLIEQLAAAGDPAAVGLDAEEAARDIEALLPAIDELRTDPSALHDANDGPGGLPVALEASWARFR